MFWAKWLGKLSGIAAERENVETTVHPSEWIAIVIMAVLVVLCCVLLPFISSYVVEPYVYSVYATLGQDISSTNLWIASILTAFVVIVLFAGVGRRSKARRPTLPGGRGPQQRRAHVHDCALGRVDGLGAQLVSRGHLRGTAHLADRDGYVLGCYRRRVCSLCRSAAGTVLGKGVV